MPDTTTTTTTTTSRVDNTHPSWYPRFLRELESRYPAIYAEITNDVVGRNAAERMRSQSCEHGIVRGVFVCPACDPERQAEMERHAEEQTARRLAGE